MTRVPAAGTRDQIAQHAYEIFLEHGATDGQDVEDWLRAERVLQAAKGRNVPCIISRPPP
jgi:hypothetical protein